MIQETTYEPSDLTDGRCVSCGDETELILIGTDQCIECIESDKFEEETNRMFNNEENE